MQSYRSECPSPTAVPSALHSRSHRPLAPAGVDARAHAAGPGKRGEQERQEGVPHRDPVCPLAPRCSARWPPSWLVALLVRRRPALCARSIASLICIRSFEDPTSPLLPLLGLRGERRLRKAPSALSLYSTPYRRNRTCGETLGRVGWLLTDGGRRTQGCRDSRPGGAGLQVRSCFGCDCVGHPQQRRTQ